LKGSGGLKIDFVLAPRYEGNELRLEYHVVAFSVQPALDSSLNGLGQIRETVFAYIAPMNMRSFDLGAHIRKKALQILAGKKSTNDSSGGILKLGMAVFEAELIGILLATSRPAAGAIAQAEPGFQMSLVMGVADQVMVLDAGVLVASGSPKEIRQNPRVIEAYVGQEEAAA
jgi:hypothetical protein